MKNNIVVLDLETGGLSSEKNPITEIGLIVYEPVYFSEVQRFQTFVKPYDDLTVEPKALEASRVDMRSVNAGMEVTQALKRLIEIFKKYTEKGRYGKPILAGHNFTDFDINFLMYMFRRSNQDLFDYVDTFIYDTIRLFAHLEANEKGADKYKYNLSALTDRYNISLTSAHGAIADVEATGKLLFQYLSRVRGGGKLIGKDSTMDEEKRRAREDITFEF